MMAGSRMRVLLDETVPADPAAPASLADRIETACSGAGIAADIIFKLNLSVDEILTNVTTHGAAGGAGAPSIRLRLAASDEAIEIEITDNGPAFDPLAQAPPDTSAGIEERPIGGLGIHLVRSLMDEVRYSRGNDGNHVVIVKRWTAPDLSSRDR